MCIYTYLYLYLFTYLYMVKGNETCISGFNLLDIRAYAFDTGGDTEKRT